MFENLAYYGSNGNPSVVVKVTLITMLIFYDWHNSSPLKLTGDTAMLKHHVEKAFEALNKRKRGIEEVLC